MDNELKKSEQEVDKLDDETRAYLKEWVNALVDGAGHQEAKQIAADEIKKRNRG